MIVRKKLFTGSFLLLLVSIFLIIISFSPAIASNGLPTVDKEWTCSNFPQTCESGTKLGICTPEPYLLMWINKPEYQLSFAAQRPGNYSCEITAIVNYFDHGTEPQYAEYTDIKLNNNPVGRTDDPCCPDTGSCPVGENGENGDGDCFGNTERCNNPLDTECIWHYFEWYGSTGRRCDHKDACNFPPAGGHTCANAGLCNHQPSNPAYYTKYMFTPFGDYGTCTGIYNNCCSAWLHGTWCGDCYGADGTAIFQAEIEPIFCGDVNYGEGYCNDTARNPSTGQITCYWNTSHRVLKGLGGEGMPEGQDGGVTCETANADIYQNILGMYHNGNDAYFGFNADRYNANYICCFAKPGSVPDGWHCVVDSECASGNCVGKAGITTPCQEYTGSDRKCVCGAGDGNQRPDTPTFVITPNECEIEKDCVFRFSATDPDGDRIRYQLDWGDGTVEYVPLPDSSVESGTERQKAHPYSTAGTYTFRVRAQERVSPGVFGQYSSYANHMFTVTSGGVTCDNNGYCTGDENPDNCPNDCEYYDICADIYYCDFDAAYGRKGYVTHLDECDGDLDCGFCFPAGTKIHMADGSLKNIEEIETGDMVLSFSEGLLTRGEVTYVHPPVKGRLYLLTTESNELLVTGEHPLYVGEGEFLKVNELEAGDYVYILDGYGISEEMITKKEMLDDYVYVYNFEVDGGTYFADGFAVHNKEPPPM